MDQNTLYTYDRPVDATERTCTTHRGWGGTALWILIIASFLAAPPAHAQLTLRRAVVGGGATAAAGGTLALRGTVAQTAAGATAGGSLSNGQGFWYVVGSSIGTPQFVLLDATLWLEGPYDASAAKMAVNLSSSLPETDPYLGSEAVSPGFFTGDATGQRVVDWVKVELRGGDPSTPPMAVEAERAALLLDDGTLVDTDGSGGVQFDGLAPGQYYLAARHRNHLTVMSAAAVDCTNGTCSYDFAGGTAYGINALVDLSGVGTGPWACFAGDGDASGGVTAADQSVWQGDNGTAGYLWGDYDLSGGATAGDQVLWLQNNGTSTQAPPGN